MDIITYAVSYRQYGRFKPKNTIKDVVADGPTPEGAGRWFKCRDNSVWEICASNMVFWFSAERDLAILAAKNNEERNKRRVKDDARKDGK
jgi:hypothetical protein